MRQPCDAAYAAFQLGQNPLYNFRIILKSIIFAHKKYYESTVLETIKYIFDLFVHLDVHLSSIIGTYGLWTYSILFLVIFIETGLVVTPFLPGDSLLFASGAFAAKGDLNIALLLLLLSTAAILGDSLNYWIGREFGQKTFKNETGRFFKKENLEKTKKFYDKYGGKTIIIARFVPIVRTFAPFVAGMGEMKYIHFLSFNIAGGLLWVVLFVGGGFLFGNIPLVKSNFSLVIFAIVIVSLLPGIIEYLRHKFAQKEEIV